MSLKIPIIRLFKEKYKNLGKSHNLRQLSRLAFPPPTPQELLAVKWYIRDVEKKQPIDTTWK